MRFLSVLLSMLVAASAILARPVDDDQGLRPRERPRAELPAVVAARQNENNPNNQVFTFNGVAYKVVSLTTTVIANGYPQLTSSAVANIAGAAWSMWNSDGTEWTATIGGAEVGVASADEVAGYGYISPTNLQTIYRTCLNYALSIGANGVIFDLILPNAPGGPRIAEFFGYAVDD